MIFKQRTTNHDLWDFPPFKENDLVVISKDNQKCFARVVLLSTQYSTMTIEVIDSLNSDHLVGEHLGVDAKYYDYYGGEATVEAFIDMYPEVFV